MTLRIGLVQASSCGRDLDANLAKGDDFCRRAAAAGADIALFPEMWSVGYHVSDANDPLAVSRNGPFVEHFRQLACDLKMAIAITYLERWPGKPRDSITLFDRKGAEVLTYAKMHLTPWGPPDTYCTAGDGFHVATLDTSNGPMRVGFMICFDREFPEAARTLALSGAELILAPNACQLASLDDTFTDARIDEFRTRAFENLAAAAMTNYAAPQNDGNSVAFGPDGRLIVRAGPAEELVIADVDVRQIRTLRRDELGRNAARRPECYAPITEKQSRDLVGDRSDGVVQLTAFHASDAPVMCEADRDPEIRRRFDFPDDFVPSIRHSEEVIERWQHERAIGARIPFAVRDVATNELVGGCEIRQLDRTRANLSYWTYPPHRRRGVASRAVALACDIALNELAFDEIEVLIDPDNNASHAVAVRNGFTRVGERDGRVLYVRRR
ncbi:MAG TPA: GNAT family N-acetyltransferase [Thermoanaerobaculia bacterium]